MTSLVSLIISALFKSVLCFNESSWWILSSSNCKPSSTIMLGYNAMASQLARKFPSNLPSLINWINSFPPDTAVFVCLVYGSKSLFRTFASLCPVLHLTSSHGWSLGCHLYAHGSLSDLLVFPNTNLH